MKEISKLLGITYPQKGQTLTTGQKLENIIKWLQITKTDIAEYLGVSDPMINFYFNDRHEMRYSKIEKLAKLGKRVLLYMFDFEQDPFVGLTAISTAKDIVMRKTK
jgi:transcriptional regulator with XRE-family HTH domain